MSSKKISVSRRTVLNLGLTTGLVLLSGTLDIGRAAEPDDAGSAEERTLHLYAPHADERFSGAYWADGAYLDDALAEVNWLMRDHATDEEKPIDPSLLDTMNRLAAMIECERPFEILSGYRTPRTNQALRREGAAKNSMHLQGKAVDIRIEGVALAHVGRAAIELAAGGVGWYPRQNFLHIDTGPVRTWTARPWRRRRAVRRS